MNRATAAGGALGICALATWIVAAAILENSQLGSQVEASCVWSPLPALVLMGIGGALAMALPTLMSMIDGSHAGTAQWSQRDALLRAAPCAVLALLTVPGTLGCGVALSIQEWPLVGGLATGAPAFALAAAAAVGIGAAAGNAWSFTLDIEAVIDEYERAKIEQ